MPVTDSTSAPELSFVVETLNLRDAHDFTPLDTALRAMHAQSIDRSRFEIIVVVDPSAEPELAGHLEANWPDVRVLEVPPGTHYYAMKNAGAVAARGAVVGYVDADCQPAPSWAESMCEALLRSDAPPSFAVGAYDTPRSLESWLARAFLVTIFANQIGRAARQTNSIAASNSAVLRERIVAEPFRDDPFFHGPDVEMATRILGRGEQIVLVPGARNIHDHEPGLASQHGRGVYWGYCFLRLRLEGSPEVKYAKLFRRLVRWHRSRWCLPRHSSTCATCSSGDATSKQAPERHSQSRGCSCSMHSRCHSGRCGTTLDFPRRDSLRTRDSREQEGPRI